jgi:hypothetical protein
MSNTDQKQLKEHSMKGAYWKAGGEMHLGTKQQKLVDLMEAKAREFAEMGFDPAKASVTANLCYERLAPFVEVPKSAIAGLINRGIVHETPVGWALTERAVRYFRIERKVQP